MSGVEQGKQCEFALYDRATASDYIDEQHNERQH
jgi:hypothetical protein